MIKSFNTEKKKYFYKFINILFIRSTEKFICKYLIISYIKKLMNRNIKIIGKIFQLEYYHNDLHLI
jgi:hypothetical protein